MKAAVFRGAGIPLEIEEVSISKPGPREVLIKTAAAGVCHSDLHYIEGSYQWATPAVLGHESAGVVEQVGAEVSYVKPGDHVITCLSVFCGHCDYCLTGRMSLCQSEDVKRGPNDEPRLTQDGKVMRQFGELSSFAEQMLVHEHAIVKIRQDMPLDRAALIGCGVTTGVGSVFHTAAVRPGSTVAVVGCGGVGLSCINGAVLAGASRIIAVDMLNSKLDMAKTFGATDVVDASEVNAVHKIKELTNGGVDYSFEAIGLKLTSEQAFKMLRRGGTATIIGMIPTGQKIELTGAAFLDEKTIKGSMMGSNRFRVDMPRFVDFYMAGKLHLDELVSKRIRLEDINEAFEDVRSGSIARSVVIFE